MLTLGETAGHLRADTGPGMTEPTLPDQTADDTDAGWGESPTTQDDDERLLDERPPHHDR